MLALFVLPLDAAHAQATAEVADATVDAAVLEVYRAFSFQDGERPDPAAIRALFTPAAQLAYVRNDSLVSASVDDYLAGWTEGVAALASLQERELGGRTERFGDVAHRASAYVVHVDGAEVERGAIFFHLLRVDGRWLVQAMAWDSEAEGRPLPAEWTE